MQSFVQKLLVLYQEGEVRHIGFTKWCIEELSHQHLLKSASHQPKVLGGPGHPTAEVMSSCLARMACIAKLAIAAVRAEFPNFDIMSAFSLLALTKHRGKVMLVIQSMLLIQTSVFSVSLDSLD